MPSSQLRGDKLLGKSWLILPQPKDPENFKMVRWIIALRSRQLPRALDEHTNSQRCLPSTHILTTMYGSPRLPYRTTPRQQASSNGIDKGCSVSLGLYGQDLTSPLVQEKSQSVTRSRAGPNVVANNRKKTPGKKATAQKINILNKLLPR